MFQSRSPYPSYYVTHPDLSPVPCLYNEDSLEVEESLSETFPAVTEELADVARGHPQPYNWKLIITASATL